MSSNARYDAFLSYNAQDRPAVEELAGRLRAEGLELYLEISELLPGREFQPGLANALIDSKTCIAFLGPNGLGPWQKEEIQVAIDKRVRDPDFHVIPVLLPGAERPRRGAVAHLEFLINASWVEFPKSLDDPRTFDSLVAGIRGIKPTLSPEEVKRWEGRRPYRGLEAFGPGDAPFFFGRENLTDWLVSDLRREIRAPAGVRFLAVLGPSGSGKSSVVLAGLIPRLKEGAIDGSERWPISVVRPGDDPLESLTEKVVPKMREVRPDPTLSEMGEQDDLLNHLRVGTDDAVGALNRYIGLKFSNESDDRRFVIVVDQFEEVFTYRPADDQSRKRFEISRDAFFANLLHVAAAPGGRVAVVLTMRSDFLGPCASFERLNNVLNAHLIQVGPMRVDELRAAIELPAFKVSCELEPGLTERLLADVEGQAGALPLLQFTLDELWQRREVRRLTLRAYTELGGVEGALEHRANETLQKLSQADQDLCRRIFLRLVQPGEGTEDTKRRVFYRELLPDDPERAEAVRRVVRALANRDARLITTQGTGTADGAVEVAHEALIRGWGRLREWIDADRAGLRIQRKLTEAAREWEAHGYDSSFLYGGTRLAVAWEWAKTHRDELNALEAEFLAASRRKRRKLKLAQAASILVMVALVIGVWALFQRREWSRSRQITLTVENDLKKARKLADEGHWSDAIQEVEVARSRLEPGVGDESLQHRLASDLDSYKKKEEEQKAQERDQKFVDALDKAKVAGAEHIREGGNPWYDFSYDEKAIISGYQQAFREYGIDIDTLPPKRAAEKIRAKAPKNRDALVAALDDWASRAGPPKDSCLRTIAREADPDPQRNAIRDAVAKADIPALRQLAHDREMARQPAPTLDRLGNALVQAREFDEAVALLRQAQRLHPDDFLINRDLADALTSSEPAQYEEAIRYYTVVVALRPDSPGANGHLGNALYNKDRHDESIAFYGEAIRLDPKFAWAYGKRGFAWHV